MAFIRRKRIKGHDYYYLVESARHNGKVRSRTLKYLGKEPVVPPPLQHLLQPRSRRRAQPLLWDFKN